MDNLPETPLEESLTVQDENSEAEGSNPPVGSRDSRNLTKMLTFAPDIGPPVRSSIRFSVAVDLSTVGATGYWAEGGEEEGGNDAEENEEEEEENREGEEEENEDETREEELELGVEEEEEEEEEEEPHPEEEKVPVDYPFQIEKEIKVKSEHDISKIPSEVYYDRSAMLQMLRDLGTERPGLTLRNRYLECKCFRHLQAIQVTGSPPIDDGSNLEDERERDRYTSFLVSYKKESDVFRERENEIKLSLDNLREKLKERWSHDAESFLELTSRETAVAVDLVFATTGRRLTQKRVEEIISRQTSRRKQVAHERYAFIRQWYMFEEIDARIRRLETLGPRMKISDYEANFSVNLTAKTKIDERNKELQKARARVCDIMAAITHGKVKLAFLREEIECKKNRYGQMVESVHKRREELSTIHSRLSITRNQYLKKRETAGLMLALPTLREMERAQELRDVWKREVDRLRSSIYKPRGTRKKRTQIEKTKTPITRRHKIPEQLISDS